MSQQPERDTCTTCKQKFPGYGGVFLTFENKSQFYCDKCYNHKIAEIHDFDFTNISFHPVTIPDSDEIDHTFYISTRIFGPNVCLEAYELKNDQPVGYRFSVMGDVEENLLTLFTKLVDRIQRQLSIKHIEPAEHYRYLITDKNTVRGYITSDSEHRLTPTLVIDGKEIPWDEFGRMVHSYEGFNFKMELFDKTEER